MGSHSIQGLVVEIAGEGDEALLLLHGAITFDGCRQLLSQPRLTDRYRVIHYYRRGYGGSAPPPPAFGIVDQAKDAAAVLRALGLPCAHVLGHSIGALIALQLAMDAPALVQSLVLVEPTFVSRPELGVSFQGALAPVIAAYAAGNREAAADHMLRLIDGDRYRGALDAAFGAGWFAHAAAALDTYFAIELPAALRWTMSPERAAGIMQPALVMRGSDTLHEFVCVADDLGGWLPKPQNAVISGATHNVVACRPQAAAEAVLAFLANPRTVATEVRA